MTVFVVGFLLILALPRYSDANFCVCNSAQSDTVLQKNIDYACGNGADCSAIMQNGACFNPNTVKDHCNYAVNSYYQRKGQITGSCDFQGTAIVTATPPTTASSGCVYQSSPSTTPSTGGTPTVGGTPAVGVTPTPVVGGTPVTGGTPPAIGGTPTSPNIGGTTSPGTVPGSTMTPGFGMAPTGNGFGSTDNSAGVKLLSARRTSATFSIFVVLISGLVFPRM